MLPGTLVASTARGCNHPSALRRFFPLALFLAAACDRAPEPTPEAPRESRPAPVACAVPARTSPPSKGPSLRWQDPSGWKREEPSSPMRKATYRIPKAAGDPEDGELGVFQFGSSGGTVQANMDRWIKQFDGVKPGDVKRDMQSVDGMRVHRVEIPTGTYKSGMPGGPTTPKQDFAMLGAIVEAPGGAWFFKLTGPKKTVTQAKTDFDAMVASMRKQ
jgi:hypothetical protein